MSECVMEHTEWGGMFRKLMIKLVPRQNLNISTVQYVLWCRERCYSVTRYFKYRSWFGALECWSFGVAISEERLATWDWHIKFRVFERFHSISVIKGTVPNDSILLVVWQITPNLIELFLFYFMRTIISCNICWNSDNRIQNGRSTYSSGR